MIKRRFNPFRFTTNKVAIFYAVLPKLKEFGYDTSIVEKMTDDYIIKGVTLFGQVDGSIGIMYSISKDACTRIDELLIILKSDNFSLSS